MLGHVGWLFAGMFAGGCVIFFLLLQKERRENRGLKHDPVTHLPFEPLACELIRRMLRRVSHNWTRGVHLVVIFTDARGLKRVNSECGQAGGDEYLLAHARLLEESVRGLVFRRGGGSRADELIAFIAVPFSEREAISFRLKEIQRSLRGSTVQIRCKTGSFHEYPLEPHYAIVQETFFTETLLNFGTDEVPESDIVSRMIAQADLQLTKITSSEK